MTPSEGRLLGPQENRTQDSLSSAGVVFRPDPVLYPFESRWFDSPAGRVHYIDEGTGPTILFCHGNPTWSFLYRHIVSSLRESFRCIAVDYLGFGLSDRPRSYGYTAADHSRTLGELVEHLDLDDFILFAQDWGGPIGTAMAIDRADRIRGVALGNTWLWPATPVFAVFSAVMSSGPMQRQIIDRNFMIERIIPFGSAKKLTRQEMDHYRGVQATTSARQGVAEFPKQIRAAKALLERVSREVPSRLGDKPALIVWGMKDPAFWPRSFLPRVSSMFRDTEVVRLPGASHYIQEDAPGEICAALRKRFA